MIVLKAGDEVIAELEVRSAAVMELWIRVLEKTFEASDVKRYGQATEQVLKERGLEEHVTESERAMLSEHARLDANLLERVARRKSGK